MNKRIGPVTGQMYSALKRERDAMELALRTFLQAGVNNSTDFEKQAQAHKLAIAALESKHV